MRLIRAKIKGLIGLYRGSNVKEIEIDFTKCKSGIILIMGGNGSGKSTLWNALNPLPDPQSNYITGEEGYKELDYQKEDTLYKILIQYPIDKYGKRATTKAYITKHTMGDIPLELNPNGNVSSYRECIYTEFKLDANFVSLTSLSLEDKGLVTKTPAERKKYVGAIVSKVEVFNNIHKVLNKRSSIFKSMINSLISKIDSIGTESDIESRINSMDERIKALSLQRDDAIKRLAKAEAVVQQLDTGGKIQAQYTDLHSQLQSVEEQIRTATLFIRQYMYDPYEFHIVDQKTAEKDAREMELEINRLTIQLQAKKDSIQIMLKEKEEDANTLSIKTAKMSSLRSEYNYESLFKQLKDTRNRIKQYEELIRSMNLDPSSTTLTRDEFIMGLNTLRDIKQQIDTFRSFNYDNMISEVIDGILNGEDLVALYQGVEQQIADHKSIIGDHERTIAEYGSLAKTMEILSKRPSKCKIDDCEFIRAALEAKKKNPEEVLAMAEVNLEACKKSLADLEIGKSKLSKMVEIRHSIDIILRMINNNRAILDKLPNGYIYTEDFLERLKSGSTFTEITDLYKYIDQANVFEEYRLDKERIVKLESDYAIYQNRAAIIEEISDEIRRLQDSLTDTVSKIEAMNKESFDIESELQSLKSIYQVIDAVAKKYVELNGLEERKEIIEKDILAISMSMQAIETAVQDINSINTDITRIDGELNPMKTERDKLGFSLSKLREYEEELAFYSAKYDKVEIIKKYSSPTKAGIQNLFINVYMGQTLRIANKLLSMFFNGKLRLKDYIIDDTQFAIPCTSLESSLDNDDISSCSGGEKSMIALILSFALLQQSSTEYNILRLDEIDGTLDQSNRSQFIEVLHIIMDYLHMENCIMISHASESALDNADIICLNMDGLGNPRGNIIYSAN